VHASREHQQYQTRPPCALELWVAAKIAEMIHLPAILGLRGHIEAVGVADVEITGVGECGHVRNIAQSFSSIEAMLRDGVRSMLS